jgi:3-hydroxyisobutyrate dehydrogenase-like beta-hydroxyacid dehydrogenase
MPERVGFVGLGIMGFPDATITFDDVLLAEMRRW